MLDPPTTGLARPRADRNFPSIISTVLNWDIKDLENRASKLERERAKLGKEQLQLLKVYTTRSQEEQDRIRHDSQTRSVSIVTAILQESNSSTTAELTELHHKQALEYLSIQLSIRDRKKLIECLCKATPDHLTISVREVVDAYEPVIRKLHKAVDLSSTVSDFEYFLKDLLKLAKVQTDKSSGVTIVPTVGDFVQLLRKHQRSCHVFIHQCCKNDTELTGWYLDWAKRSASHFRRKPADDPNDPGATTTEKGGAGNMTPALEEIFSSLPQETRRCILPILDSHSTYLETMHAQSAARLARVLKSPPSKNPAIAKIFSSAARSRPASRSSSPSPPISSQASKSSPALSDDSTIFNQTSSPTTPEVSSSPGPGSFLARWQALLEATPITPLTQSGPVKSASSPEVVQSSATDVDGSPLVHFGAKEARGEKIHVDKLNKHENNDKTDLAHQARQRQKQLKVVIDAMHEQFRALLAERACYW